MTAPEILALLAADPALAVEVAAGLPGLRIAGPWIGQPHLGKDNPDRWDRRSLGTAWSAASVWQSARPDAPKPWIWSAAGPPHGLVEGRATTREDAFAAADAALRAGGWRLAP